MSCTTSIAYREDSEAPNTARSTLSPPLPNEEELSATAKPAPAAAPASPTRHKPIILNKTKSNRGEQRGFVAPRPFEGPPVSNDVERLRQLPAKERVALGYRMLKESYGTRGTAAFRSSEPRDPYNMGDHRIKNPQMLAKQHMLEDRQQQLADKCGIHGPPVVPVSDRSGRALSAGSARRQARSSSWARDTTARGNFLFNWNSMPQCIPKRYIDPTPGPGSYTPTLHYVGGTH